MYWQARSVILLSSSKFSFLVLLIRYENVNKYVLKIHTVIYVYRNIMRITVEVCLSLSLVYSALCFLVEDPKIVFVGQMIFLLLSLTRFIRKQLPNSQFFCHFSFVPNDFLFIIDYSITFGKWFLSMF